VCYLVLVRRFYHEKSHYVVYEKILLCHKKCYVLFILVRRIIVSFNYETAHI
jgi:hypothetical protein